MGVGVTRVQGAGEDMSVPEMPGDRTQLEKHRGPGRESRCCGAAGAGEGQRKWERNQGVTSS